MNVKDLWRYMVLHLLSCSLSVFCSYGLQDMFFLCRLVQMRRCIVMLIHHHRILLALTNERVEEIPYFSPLFFMSCVFCFMMQYTAFPRSVSQAIAIHYHLSFFTTQYTFFCCHIPRLRVSTYVAQ